MKYSCSIYMLARQLECMFNENLEYYELEVTKLFKLS